MPVPLIVQAKDSANVVRQGLSITIDGKVGMGTTVPGSTLSIKSHTSGAVLSVFSDTHQPILMVSENIGVGTASPTEALEVAGTISANYFDTQGIIADTLDVHDRVIIVDNNSVGINLGEAEAPGAQFDIVKRVKTQPSSAVKFETVQIDIGAIGTDLKLRDSITGVSINVSSKAGVDHALANQLGDNQTVTGLDIDLTDIILAPKSKLIGIQSNVAKTISSGSETAGPLARKAALFLGGLVGIGTSQPSETLEVEGVISGNYFI